MQSGEHLHRHELEQQIDNIRATFQANCIFLPFGRECASVLTAFRQNLVPRHELDAARQIQISVLH